MHRKLLDRTSNTDELLKKLTNFTLVIRKVKSTQSKQYSFRPRQAQRNLSPNKRDTDGQLEIAMWLPDRKRWYL